jgi:hypothetical protein
VREGGEGPPAAGGAGKIGVDYGKVDGTYIGFTTRCYDKVLVCNIKLPVLVMYTSGHSAKLGVRSSNTVLTSAEHACLSNRVTYGQLCLG